MGTKRSEKAELNDTLVAVSSLPKSLVRRNNTGLAWQGKKVDALEGDMIRVEPNMVILREARPIKFGLVGSGDIDGSVDGAPLAIEMKTEDGRQSQDQKNFEKAWKKAGGIYILARSCHEALFKIIFR